MQFVFTALILLFCASSYAQYENIVFRDDIYRDNIRTVKFHIAGLYTSYPIVRLGSRESLRLAFDDMDSDAKYYTYTVVHCTEHWEPSDLLFNEYVDGFEDLEIENFAYSVNTYVNYSHYELVFPNDDFEITKSGNYLLIVHENANYNRPVLTRRFMVVDPRVGISATMQRPAIVSKNRTHQELDFEVNTEDVRILNPKSDISAVVMQNGRWDTALKDISSRYEHGNLLIFDYQDKIVFPAGQDFRNMDIRSTQYRSEDIFAIEKAEDHIVVIGEIDKPRALTNFISDEDINGNFVILTTDDQRFSFQHRLDPDTIWTKEIIELTDHVVEADYLHCLFTLETPRLFDQDVYILGGITDWQLRERFRMTYYDDVSAYQAEVFLKQGFYDYIYALANSDGSADETTIEGNWYEADNTYTILIYYHPFGGRYDQLIGAMTVASQ